MDTWISLDLERIARGLLSAASQMTLAQKLHVSIFSVALVLIITNVSKPKIVAITAVIISYFVWRVNFTILPFVHESSALCP